MRFLLEVGRQKQKRFFLNQIVWQKLQWKICKCFVVIVIIQKVINKQYLKNSAANFEIKKKFQ